MSGYFLLPWWGYVLAALALTHVTIASVTIFLHRHQAHRALELHPAASHFFRCWLWLTTGMVTREWVSVHRKHHDKVESQADPHSPRIHGIHKVLWGGTWLYRAEAAKPETLRDYGQGTPDDWLENKLYARHPCLGILLMLTADLLLFGAAGVPIWAVQMIWIPFFAAGVINGLAHWWGYRNFECPDGSTNLTPLGLLIGGEEMHNNHHAFTGSAKFSVNPWEFDIGWLYIRVLQALGLAQVKKVFPQRPVRDHSKKIADLDTLAAGLGNRHHVMAAYLREVVSRVCRQEIRQQADRPTRSFLRRYRKLLVRDKLLLGPVAEERLQEMLRSNKAVRTVYQYKQRLQSLWQQKTATSKERHARLRQLSDWCRQAEETGIQALADFAAKLRGYTCQTA